MGRVFRDKTATRRFATRAQREVMRRHYVRFRSDPETRRVRSLGGTLHVLVGDDWIPFASVRFPMENTDLATHILTAERIRRAAMNSKR